MSKERFLELITKELIEEIQYEERIELKSLLEKDPAYLIQYNLFKKFWVNGQLPHTDHHANLDKIKSRIAELEQPEAGTVLDEKRKKRYLRHWLQAAAVILMITGATTIFYLPYHNKSLQQQAKTTWQIVQTAKGTRKLVRLTDGTTVTMNFGTRLLFPVAFNGPTREVYLTGEAFFDVHKDHEHPFIIHTEKMNVRVLGTAFNVKAYANDQFSETTLLRGAVEVTLKDRPSDRFTLKPTEKLVVHFDKTSQYPDKSVLESTKPNAQTEITYLQRKDTTIVETAWLQNKLIFSDEDFESLSKEMERRYNYRFAFENQDLKKLKFSGTFTRETVEEALSGLQLTEHFSFTIHDHDITIK